ncbi:FMN reductase [Rhodococcus sp. NPDC059968]|uniref:FMN reductase n=1 Tax=Rhodococcus sp. NPDC059968 TaxID=3347017 RepID=UPI003671B74F
MNQLTVMAVAGSLQEPSKTRALVELILATLAERTQISTRIVEVHQLGTGLTSALSPEDLDEATCETIRAVESADLLIAASPVYRGSYTGLFKHFFDFVDQYALANKPVLIAATGGSDRHALVLEHAMRPLFAFFQALVAPVGIYLSAGDFDGTTILNPEAYERIEVAVNDILPVAHAMAADESVQVHP